MLLCKSICFSGMWIVLHYDTCILKVIIQITVLYIRDNYNTSVSGILFVSIIWDWILLTTGSSNIKYKQRCGFSLCWKTKWLWLLTCVSPWIRWLRLKKPWYNRKNFPSCNFHYFSSLEIIWDRFIIFPMQF